jgi:hypothetical protein
MNVRLSPIITTLFKIPMSLFSNSRLRLRRFYRQLVRNEYAKDLLLDLQLDAKRESITYIKQHMRASMICSDRPALHRLAFDHVSLDGLILEFGVKRGATIKGIAAFTSQPVHGFDSFAGLPEDWSGTTIRKGKFSTGGRLPRVPANVTLYAGWFDDSLPKFVAAHTGNVAFMHVDCDLYSSTKTVFECFADRIISGTVIVFDEYFNHPNWQDHEFKAFQEFIQARGFTYDYLAFTAQGGSVAVKIR